MRVLSPILRQIVYPALGKVGFFRLRAGMSVVTYHGVLPEGYRNTDAFLDNTLIRIDAFRAQLALLKRYYNVVSPARFQAWLRGSEALPERAVLITCDDGFLNNLTVMAPILREHGLQCIFFSTSDSLGKAPAMLWYIELYLMIMKARATGGAVDCAGIHVPTPDGDQETRRTQWLRLTRELSRFTAEHRQAFLSELARRWRLDADWKASYLNDPLLAQRFQLLGAEQLRQLADAGMTIGAHTRSHPELSQQPDEEARREVIECRCELQECIGRSIWAMAYPFGNPATVGEREFRLAREAGFECAFMNVPGKFTAENKFSMPRAHVTADMSLGVFEAHVSGFHERLRQRLRGA